ncbi:MAG: ribosome biogenesis GTP-binding protein YihA/YsxC [Bacilli bacterium]|jgi:GTP-binding protein|nr:ribosome biogenesis GTP-binding protein YihA/YsxC [Bacilli bacterium]MDD2681490.1 ribosome biogenesis GTP-binding protein YihA/YsxC [Bacilli bacterium]MDD3121570.1 ribosome biogenesis GTP-binding protein YihA/YsxC [Bacilli bacterium]MDD4062929.1 ribosome biogenesis GTP-binding protein YihA/YsxC [Bacilli bacterium]MDD4482287.1 ribosome biogenesis GTP-binding protein YihA/YsxC [Bacilli bacterium]
MFNKCEYVISAVSKKQNPNTANFPEFVFLGRSNVGKSSFINFLVNRKLLARTSTKPGKTIAVNFYNIDDIMFFVDVPGYGYAARSEDQKNKFGEYIEQYLVNNSNIAIAFLLIDTKVGPTKDDIIMINYLQYLGLNIKVIATKCDKVGTTHLFKHKVNIINKLSISESSLFLTSSLKNIGRENIINLIEEIVF